MDAVESEADGSDPMELLLVNRHDHRESFTRYRLQETLMLMGCRPKDAVLVTKEVFNVFAKYKISHRRSIDLTSETDPATAKRPETYQSSVNGEENAPLGPAPPPPPSSSQEEDVALPWHYLHQCIYTTLNQLDYTKPHHLLDFQVAKEITQRNQSFTVLLGGTSGTGKSTLASLLATRLRLTTVLPTDSVRHILRAFTSKEENPCAFVSTYQAGDALTPEEIEELSVATDGVMSANRLHKRKILRGYKLQSDLVLEKLDKVLTMFERRKQSLVVEGVHLNTDQMAELVRRHPTCVPFVIYISNEHKHRERFAVRARHMTIDPQENKYIKYFDNIRIIQRHLCKHADKYLIPKIDNTNVDRSIATIQSTLIRVLRKLDRGEKILDERINKMVMLSREHENSIKKAWSSKGVRKAMRPLVNQKVSKRLLLRRLLAEQTTGIVGANSHGDDSSSSDEERPSGNERNGDEGEDEEEDDEQTTVVGSLFSGTTRDNATGATAPNTPRRVFLDEMEEHAAGSSDNAKMMRSLSTAIQQAAIWRASQPLSSSDYTDWENLAPPRSPEVTFSDVITTIQSSPGFAEMKHKWRSEERRKSWMAGDAHSREDAWQPHGGRPTTANAAMRTASPTRSSASDSPMHGKATPAEMLSHFQRYHHSHQQEQLQFHQQQMQQDGGEHKHVHHPLPPLPRRTKAAARRVQSLPADTILDFSAADFDMDSISVRDPNDDETFSQTSSQRDGCKSSCLGCQLAC